MADGFVVDLGAMTALADALGQAAQNVTSANDALKGTSVSDLGSSDLDSAGADVQDRWTYGSGKIGELAGQMVQGVRACVQNYQEAEQKKIQIFEFITGLTDSLTPSRIGRIAGGAG